MQLTGGAVLAIDWQNDFCHEQGSAAKADNDVSLVQKLVPQVQQFLAQARRYGVPIIHIQTEHSKWSDSPSWRHRFKSSNIDTTRHCRAGSWGAEFYQILPQPDEYIITKHRYSAFIDTELDLILRSLGITTIILTGVTSNVCIESTARDGFMKDYNVIVLEDCTAAYTMRERESALFNIGKYFGTVTSSKKVVAEWRRQSKKHRGGSPLS